MSSRKRIHLLAAVLAGAVMMVVGITVAILYDTSFEQQRLLLGSTAEAQAKIMGAVARFDAAYSTDDVPGGAAAATLSQIRDAHRSLQAFGKSGEFVLACLWNDSIRFSMSSLGEGHPEGIAVPFRSELAEPMRRALLGESGTMIGLDHHGVRVLAAYEPVAELGMGLVAKVDLAEIRAPFFRAGLLTLISALVLIMVGTLFITRISTPMLKELIESERRFRTIFEQASDSFMLIDPQTGRIVEFNERTCHNLGYTRDEFANLTVMDLDAGKSPEDLQALMQRICREGRARFESRITLKDGKLRDVIVEANAVTLKGSTFVTASWRDITEQKRAADELKRSEAKYLDYYDNAPDMYISVDACTAKVLDCNATLARKTGYAKSEIIGRSVFRLYHDECMDEARATFQQWIETGEVHDRVLALKARDGSRIDVRLSATSVRDAAGVIIRSRSVWRDITALKKAEAALRESEERYRQLVDNTDTGFVVVDDQGVVVEANEPYLRLIGAETMDDVLGHAVFEWTAPESVDDWRAAVARCIEQGFVRDFETTFLHRDGRRVIIQINAALYETAEGKHLTGLCKDITARRQVEMALRESENKLLETQRTARLGYCDYDAIADRWASSAVTDEIFGIDETYERNLEGWRRLVHPDHREQMWRYFQDDVIGRCQEFDREYEIVDAATGQTKWVHGLGTLRFDDDGNPVGMMGTIQDITERKLAEIKLKVSEERFRQVVAHAADAFFLTTLDGMIVDVNAQACRQLGYSRDELLDMKVTDFMEGVRPEPVVGGDVGLTSDLAVTRWGDHVRKDGSTYPVESRIIRVQLEGFGHLIWLSRDITERLEIEAEVARAKRLEFAGQLAAQIAHDFNNLLGPLTAYPSMIRQGMAADDASSEMLADMEDAARQIAEINQELLTLGRRAHYPVQSIDLNRSISDVLRTFQVAERIEVRTELAAGLPTIQGGLSQITRVLVNLISNACDAMPEAGTLTIATDRFEASVFTGKRCAIPPGEYVRLRISDTGPGIPDELQARIFEPFFTTKRSDKMRGSGLGLSVVDAVVQDYNGYVEVESAAGAGTTFTVCFPAQSHSGPDAATTEELPLGQGQTVLVVDDDPVQLRLAERVLTRLNYNCTSVTSGEEAVELARRRSYDILLVDMVMDGIDGAETIRRIEELHPGQASLVLSGYAANERVDVALSHSARGFLSKPVHIEPLARALHAILHDQPVPP